MVSNLMDKNGGQTDGNGRVDEWEAGLPNLQELTPLSQTLVPPDLASAFIISPHPPYTVLDLHRASHTSFLNLIGHPHASHHYLVDPTTKFTTLDCSEQDSDSPLRNPKKARLLWTPQLHNRFVDVVAHLGIHNALPNTILQLLNVDGLTRENVASHLQKYRLYWNRMHALSTEPPPSSSSFSFGHLPPSSHYSSLPMPVPAAFGKRHDQIGQC